MAGSRPPPAIATSRSLHVARRRIRRAVAVRHAARLRLERVDRRLVGLGRCRKGPEDGAAALLAGHRGRHILVKNFSLPQVRQTSVTMPGVRPFAIAPSLRLCERAKCKSMRSRPSRDRGLAEDEAAFRLTPVRAPLRQCSAAPKAPRPPQPAMRRAQHRRRRSRAATRHAAAKPRAYSHAARSPRASLR